MCILGNRYSGCCTGWYHRRGDAMKNQKSYSRLWDGYTTDKDAMQARNKEAKRLRSEGKRVLCESLPGQMKKYDGICQYNGSVCTVYMLTVLD